MDEVKRYLKTLLKDNDTIILGCSGGPDSMALLDLLLKCDQKIKIVCAHVNHNVRVESKKEEEFLKEYCAQNKVLFESITLEKFTEDNFHNIARKRRYDFFETLVKKYQAQFLMTAHHGDDLIETILMRLVRGSSLGGYAGFARIVDRDGYTLVRPLITVNKEEILAYNKKENIPYKTDKSNEKDIYTRNRYRKNVLPFLKKEEKNVHEKFLKFSNMLYMYDNYLNEEMQKIKTDIYKANVLDLKKYAPLDEVLKNKILYSILEDEYLDDLFLLTDQHVILIRKLIDNDKKNSYIYLPNNVKMNKSYDCLKITREKESLGKYEIELGDLTYLPNNKCIEMVKSALENNNDYIRLNICDISLPLKVRNRSVGDKIEVKGLKGTKKIKDIFIDLKMPLEERDSYPLVTDNKGVILWIPGLKKSKYDIPKNKKCDIILKYYK